MAKYSVVFEASRVVMTDKQGKSVDYNYEASMDLADAVNETKSEQAKRGTVARAHLTILRDVLDNPRVDAYKGKTEIGGKLSPEFKSAVREAEVTTLQADFVANLVAKNNTQAQALAMWDTYIGQLRDGMYARYKATASLYFAYFGLLPCVYVNGKADKTRLLSVTTMEKLIANAKTDLAQEENEGISLAISKLAHEVRSRTEKTHLGDIKRAIYCLKEMLATYEGLDNEAAQAATDSHLNLIESKVEKQSKEKQLKRTNAPKHDVVKTADQLIAKAAEILTV